MWSRSCTHAFSYAIDGTSTVPFICQLLNELMTFSYTELRDVANKFHAFDRVSQNGPIKLQPRPEKQQPRQQKQQEIRNSVRLPETTDEWMQGLLASPNTGGAYIAGDAWWVTTVPSLSIRWLIQHGFQLDTFKLTDAVVTAIIQTVKNAYERGQLCRSYDNSAVPLRSIQSTITYIILWYRYWYDKATQIPQSPFVPVLAVFGTYRANIIMRCDCFAFTNILLCDITIMAI